MGLRDLVPLGLQCPLAGASRSNIRLVSSLVKAADAAYSDAGTIIPLLVPSPSDSLEGWAANGMPPRMAASTSGARAQSSRGYIPVPNAGSLVQQRLDLLRCFGPWGGLDRQVDQL